MRPFVLRIGVVLTLAVGGLLAAGASASAPAGADPIGSCTTTIGTIIAVDFSHWGGPVVRGCGTTASSGYLLLHDAGFTSAGDAHDGPAFMCRIGNEAFRAGTQYPTPAEDACRLTPPSSAYWSFWVAPRGQDTWSYSAKGATGDAPKPGAVELWTFGGTDLGGTTGSGVPTFGPDSLRAQNTTPVVATVPVAPAPVPTPTTGPPATPVRKASPVYAPAPVTTLPPASGGAGMHAPPTTPAPRTTTSVPRAASTPGASPPARPASAAPTPRIVDALPVVHEHAASGSLAPLLITIGLIALLASGAAGTFVRRRKQADRNQA